MPPLGRNQGVSDTQSSENDHMQILSDAGLELQFSAEYVWVVSKPLERLSVSYLRLSVAE